MQVTAISSLWSFDLQKLFPDTPFSAKTMYDIRLGLSLFSLPILILSMSFIILYYLFVTLREKRAFTTEIKDTCRSIKETVENNYTIHQRDSLSPSIAKANEEEARQDFDLSQGSLAGRLFDIHLNEVSIFASIIREASLSFTSHSNIILSSPELLGLFNELLIGHNATIKIYHNSLITDLFSYGNSTHAETMVEHFNKQADIETKLRCKELFSALKIKNLSTCSDMVFPLWKPIKKNEPQRHQHTEENAT